MFRFERTDAFELTLADLYDAVIMPLTERLATLNPGISFRTELCTGPGFQESATGVDEQAQKSSIELAVFLHGKQVLYYHLSYSDSYHDADGELNQAAFYRSIRTRFFDTPQAAFADAQAYFASLDFDAPITEAEQAAWDALRNFSLDPQLLRREVEEDLLTLLQEVV